MSDFERSLQALIDALDPERHQTEISRLRRARNLRDLEALATTDQGFLTASGPTKLRLVKHGSGTFLILEYTDGWGKTLATQPFRGAGSYY